MHARNLCHISGAMFDAWATYDAHAAPWLFAENNSITALVVASARTESIAYAAYTLVRARFASSPGFAAMRPQYEAAMVALGLNTSVRSLVGDSAAAIGLRVAQTYISFGLGDGSRQSTRYDNGVYSSVNAYTALDILNNAGNPNVADITRWQPIELAVFIGQGGQLVLGGAAVALSPEWGSVTPFAMLPANSTVFVRQTRDERSCVSSYQDDDVCGCRMCFNGTSYRPISTLPWYNTTWPVYHDPGPPPVLNGVGDAQWRAGHQMVALWSGMLDPNDNVTIDISPSAIGNSNPPTSMAALGGGNFSSYYKVLDGGDVGAGYAANPVTGLPYAPNVVRRGDYARVLAEFFADGPDAETPPGHWFSILNYVRDSALSNRRMGGVGAELDPLEYDVKVSSSKVASATDCTMLVHALV